jgi:hypothetical protein
LPAVDGFDFVGNGEVLLGDAAVGDLGVAQGHVHAVVGARLAAAALRLKDTRTLQNWATTTPFTLPNAPRRSQAMALPAHGRRSRLEVGRGKLPVRVVKSGRQMVCVKCDQGPVGSL